MEEDASRMYRCMDAESLRPEDRVRIPSGCDQKKDDLEGEAVKPEAGSTIE